MHRMSSAPASVSDFFRLSPRRELVLGAALTALFAGLVLAIGPAPGDAPVHLYRTFLVRDGALVWANFWYAGTYPLASYSLLYSLPAALVGTLPLVFAAAVVSTVLFSSIALREWGRAALWPSRIFGVLAAAPLFTGLYAYTLGFAAMLATLKLLQLRRLRLAVVLAALTVGFSPLAFAFLCLIVGSYALSRRQIARRHVWFGAGLAAAAGIEVLSLVLFPGASGGVYPFHWIDFVAVIGVTALGLLVARRARGAGPLVAFYALWGLGSVVVYIVPSPLGDNWTRLSAFVFPVMLLTASLAGFQPRRLVVLALAAAFAYNVIPYALLVPSRLGNDTQQASFWRPALGFLRAHEQPGFRVEVVPTAEHWEAYWIPKSGFPLARGWYRQPDVAENPAPYANPPPAPADPPWLRSPALLGVPPLAAFRSRPIRPPQHDRAARLGGRPAGVARRALAALRFDRRLPEPGLDDLRASARDADPHGPRQSGDHLLRSHRDPWSGLRGRALPHARPLQPVPAPAGRRLRRARPGQDDLPGAPATRAVRAQRARHAGRARSRALRRHRSDLRVELAHRPPSGSA